MSEEEMSLATALAILREMEEECHRIADSSESPQEWRRNHNRAEALGMIREMHE